LIDPPACWTKHAHTSDPSLLPIFVLSLSELTPSLFFLLRAQRLPSTYQTSRHVLSSVHHLRCRVGGSRCGVGDEAERYVYLSPGYDQKSLEPLGSAIRVADTFGRSDWSCRYRSDYRRGRSGTMCAYGLSCWCVIGPALRPSHHRPTSGRYPEIFLHSRRSLIIAD
jgi:hypothetical protein